MTQRTCVCPMCHGHGKADLYQLRDYFDPCPNCDGVGVVFMDSIPDTARRPRPQRSYALPIAILLALVIIALMIVGSRP